MHWQSNFSNSSFANKLLSSLFFLKANRSWISVPILFSHRTSRVHLVDTVLFNITFWVSSLDPMNVYEWAWKVHREVAGGRGRHWVQWWSSDKESSCPLFRVGLCWSDHQLPFRPVTMLSLHPAQHKNRPRAKVYPDPKAKPWFRLDQDHCYSPSFLLWYVKTLDHLIVLCKSVYTFTLSAKTTFPVTPLCQRFGAS